MTPTRASARVAVTPAEWETVGVHPMPALEVRPSSTEGSGAFATRPLHAGEIVLVLDDSRVVDDGHPLRAEAGEAERHCDYLAGGRVVLLPPPSCFINSSCAPNTCVRTVNGIRHVIALRAIPAGEEV